MTNRLNLAVAEKEGDENINAKDITSPNYMRSDNSRNNVTEVEVEDMSRKVT